MVPMKVLDSYKELWGRGSMAAEVLSLFCHGLWPFHGVVVISSFHEVPEVEVSFFILSQSPK